MPSPMLPVAILAGGLAKRLRPITETIPKALVDVAGKPFIVRQLGYLREQGISNVVLCVGHYGDLIRDAVGTGEAFGLKVSYSQDGPSLLGTGGAIRKAIPLLGDEFFILYGDSFLPVNFLAVQEAYKNTRHLGLMAILKNNNRWDKSNVLFIDGKLLEYNKRFTRPEMFFIDYGLGIVSSSAFTHYPTGSSFDLSDVYHALSLLDELLGFEVFDRFYEVGSHHGLKDAVKYFLTKDDL